MNTLAHQELLGWGRVHHRFSSNPITLVFPVMSTAGSLHRSSIVTAQELRGCDLSRPGSRNGYGASLRFVTARSMSNTYGQLNGVPLEVRARVNESRGRKIVMTATLLAKERSVRGRVIAIQMPERRQAAENRPSAALPSSFSLRVRSSTPHSSGFRAPCIWHFDQPAEMAFPQTAGAWRYWFIIKPREENTATMKSDFLWLLRWRLEPSSFKRQDPVVKRIRSRAKGIGRFQADR